MSEPLFSCTKCHKKFPFHKLSGSAMQCGDCQAQDSKVLGPTVCTYCREEYQSSDDSSSICAKCDQNVKQYGKPRACEICNIIAAFIGGKCQRCVISEKKWGAAVTCEQCKQRCAFNRNDPKKKPGNKILCWLCTVAYKRVLAKARKKEISLFTDGSTSAESQRKSKNDKRESKSKHTEGSPSKKRKVESSSKNGAKIASSLAAAEAGNFMHDMNIVLVTQLREEVESLKKTLAQRDKLLLEKEIKLTNFKTEQMEADKLQRDKIAQMNKQHSSVVHNLQQKNKDLLKQIAALSKMNRKYAGSGTGSPATR